MRIPSNWALAWCSRTGQVRSPFSDMEFERSVRAAVGFLLARRVRKSRVPRSTRARDAGRVGQCLDGLVGSANPAPTVMGPAQDVGVMPHDGRTDETAAGVISPGQAMARPPQGSQLHPAQGTFPP
jgi:hypothetical protein